MWEPTMVYTRHHNLKQTSQLHTSHQPNCWQQNTMNSKTTPLNKHFKFAIIPAGEWRRINGTNPLGGDGDRPHFVPVTDRAHGFAALDAFGACGRTGLCPGEILIDGEWKTGYRFIRISDDVI
jgi:hypothetical protein